MTQEHTSVNPDYFSGDAWKYSFIEKRIQEALHSLENNEPFAVDLYDLDIYGKPVRISLVVLPSTREILLEAPEGAADYPILLHAYDFLHKLAQRGRMPWLSEENTTEKYYGRDQVLAPLLSSAITKNIKRMRVPLMVQPNDIHRVVVNRQDKVHGHATTRQYRQALREHYPVNSGNEIPFPTVALILAIDSNAEVPYKQPEKRTILFQHTTRQAHDKEQRNFQFIHPARVKVNDFVLEPTPEREEVQ